MAPPLHRLGARLAAVALALALSAGATIVAAQTSPAVPAARGAAADAGTDAGVDVGAGAAGPAAPPGLRGPGASGESGGVAHRSAGAPALDSSAGPAPGDMGLVGLRGGGDAAPVCRSGCAGQLYRCLSAAIDDTCQAVYRTCRVGCETGDPIPGRLVSPLPDAGLAPAGPLRALPGGLPAPPPQAPRR